MFLAALKDAAIDRGLATAFLRLHPLIELPRESWLEGSDQQQLICIYHGQTVYVDLGLDEADQWGQVRSRLRSQIRKLARDGFTVSWNDWSRYGHFLSIYELTMRQVAASERYFFGPDYFFGLKAVLGDRLHLGLVEAPGGNKEIAATKAEAKGYKK